jgi:hypothetical protein
MDIRSLIDQYSSGNVIPILGCELLRINVGIDMDYNIHEYMIKKLFQPNTEWPKPPDFLSELPLSMPNINQNTIIGLYRQIQEKEKNVQLLRKIAGMKHFQIFIVGSFFKDFEKQFRLVNPDEIIDVEKNDSNSVHSLTNINFENERRKLVYLFDNTDNPYFSLSDEELMESMHVLSRTATLNSPKSLLSNLTGKTLLFIGCDFSDWFMRYCIRVLTNMPYGIKPHRTYIVNNHPTSLNYQNFFFKKHKIQLLQAFPVKEFIDQFCHEADNVQEFHNRFSDSRVFISYDNGDADTAKQLYNALRVAGIDPWLDITDKVAGKHEETIVKQILNSKTKVMINIISSTLMERMANPGRNYVRDVEWDYAMVREKGKVVNIDDNFYSIPYFVDNPRPYLSQLPPFLKDDFRFGKDFGGIDNLIKEIEKKL